MRGRNGIFRGIYKFYGGYPGAIWGILTFGKEGYYG